jgi:magnesium transporter
LLAKAPANLRDATMPAAYTIMADIVDGYAKAAADVESDLEELEEQVFNDSTSEDHRRIYKVRKDIGRIDRAVSSIAAALRESTDHLEALTVGREHIVPYLHDLLDDAAGTAALINNQSRALDAILSSHENNVSARQNKDMRTISAFAALLALPTLIAGIYGMNFKNIPLVQWQYGWVAIGVAIVVVDLIIYIMFKRRGWL